MPQYSGNVRGHGTHPDWKKSKEGGLLNTNVCLTFVTILK